MLFISNRDITISSTTGHSIEFKKGEPTNAPAIMYAELLTQGIVPTEPVEEAPVEEGTVAPQDPAQLKAAVFAAFEKIALKNDRNDFTAAGAPHLSTMSKVLGWNVNAKERDNLFAAWNLEHSAK